MRRRREIRTLATALKSLSTVAQLCWVDLRESSSQRSLRVRCQRYSAWL